MKNAIVVIDATPFKMWYEAHYALPLGHKKNQKLSEAEEKIINKKRSSKCEKKYKERQKESALEDQFGSGRVIASISSRPGQYGRAEFTTNNYCGYAVRRTFRGPEQNA